MSAAGPPQGTRHPGGERRAAPIGGDHISAANFVIDVIIPVYNAPDDVRDCLASVLSNLRPDARVVLIDDASPDPRIAALFAEIEARAHPQVVLLQN